VIITDTLNGRTVEDVRRNQDGSVTFYTDNGRTLTLYVENARIEVKPPKLILPDSRPIEDFPSERMHLAQAFIGHMIQYASYDDQGFITFVCEPQRGREMFRKSHGHREIRLTHSSGLIDELPPVSAVVALPSLSVLGETSL